MAEFQQELEKRSSLSKGDKEEEKAQTMTNVLHVVQSVLGTAISSAYPGFTQLKGIVQSAGGKFGDYKCMAAMPIAKVCALYARWCVCVLFWKLKWSILSCVAKLVP